jgi:hypothetical protein
MYSFRFYVMALDAWIPSSFWHFTFGALESWLAQSYFGNSGKEIISPLPTEIWILELQLSEIWTSHGTYTYHAVYIHATDGRINSFKPNIVCYSTQVRSFVDS